MCFLQKNQEKWRGKGANMADWEKRLEKCMYLLYNKKIREFITQRILRRKFE